ncbi:MAG TPA: S41 family peptidase [Candidatus Acidoferrales bacterium]|nr:S41 family peptidase [Candidatus Acidoferrales bacterium]
MPVRVRALLAALIVVTVAAAAALLVGYRSGVLAGQSGIDVATTGDVGDLFGTNQPSGPQLAGVALRRLEVAYYMPVEPQTPISGEATTLRDYLRAKKISNPSLPAESANGDVNQDAARAADLLAFAQSHYGSRLGSQGSSDLTEAALRGIMDSVKDPYTVYLSPREIQGLNETLDGGNFGGIGVYIYQLRDGRIVVQPIQDMPAARAGMKPGEVVDTVGGKSVRSVPLDRVEQMIRGVAGTTVRLTTHPYNGSASHERTYDIVREVIHVPTVRQKMENGFDYIRLSDFGTTSGDEVRKALLEGQAKGAKGYILDLRDNGGGLLDAAVQISSLFIPQGTIVSTIRRDGSRTTDDALGTAIPGLRPLVILVNKYTASASEITSGALQDYHLATLIGTRTFGKGVVQSIYPLAGSPLAGATLPGDGALKITTARYVTPAGRDIQHKGIEPDIVVNQDPDPSIIDTPADKQLAAAKARLRSLTASTATR